MRAASRLLFLICTGVMASGLVAGCGSTGAQNFGLSEKALKASDARLKIFREENLLGVAAGARVKVDGREVANLGSGGSTLLDVAAGSHRISVDHWSHPNEYAMTLVAKPGMLYTLEVSPRTEAAVAGMFGLVGMAVEAAANENGGTYQIRIVDEKPLKG